MLRIAPNIQQQLQATIGWRPEPRRNSFWQPRQSLFPFLPERPTTAPDSARRAIPSRSTCVGGVGSVNRGRTSNAPQTKMKIGGEAQSEKC